MENAYWRHTSAWWLQWDRFERSLDGCEPAEGMARYIELSQAFQAEALGIAATISRSRFPRCGGFLVWMGHDTFPCPSNTSVIDFEGNPKPRITLSESFPRRTGLALAIDGSLYEND